MSNQGQISNYQPSELEIFIHDIASPLSNIGISLECMKSQIYSNPHQLEKTIVDTIDSLEYLFSITRQNISNSSTYKNQKYLLSALINEILTNKFGFILNKNQIRLTQEIDESIYVHVDRTLLNRVITNIISNSLDALIEKTSSNNKKLKISIKKSRNQVKLTIIDNGIGIDSKFLKKILNYGYSGKKHHHGIGLPSSKNIIENQFGGKFQIHSLIGIGTVVKIYLPN